MQNELFNREGEQCGTETTVDKQEVTARLDDNALAKVYSGRTQADNSPALVEYAPRPGCFACKCNRLRTRGYSSKPCAKCGEYATRTDAEKEKYADKGRKTRNNSASVHPLYTSGESKTDEFKRAYAVKYLTYRACFASERSKGKADADGSAVGKHHYKFFNRSVIEDICQDAFIIYWEAKQAGKFVTTRVACRFAMGNFLRDSRTQQRSIDAVAVRAQRAGDKEQSKRNAANLDAGLLDAVRQEGTADLRTLGSVFLVSKQAMHKRLAKQRAELLLG